MSKLKVETNDMFDRRIDVYFYSATELVGILKCPDTGVKPKIKFEGKIFYTGVSASCKVTITNLSNNIDPNSVRYLKLEMYYGQNTRQKGIIVLDCLWADSSKEPPERDFTFHCMPAGQSLEIMNNENYVVSFPKQEGGWSVDDALQQVVTAYNDALDDMQGSNLIPSMIASSLKLSNKIQYSSDTLKTLKIFIDNNQDKIYNIIEELKTLALEGNPRHRLTITIATGVTDQNSLIVGTTFVSKSHSYADNYKAEDNEDDAMELKYIKNATRQGPIITVTMLYDPRITINKWCKINPKILTAKRAGGTLVVKAGTEEQPYKFQLIGDISVVFSTVEENQMVLSAGVIYEES